MDKFWGVGHNKKKEPRWLATGGHQQLLGVPLGNVPGQGTGAINWDIFVFADPPLGGRLPATTFGRGLLVLVRMPRLRS